MESYRSLTEVLKFLSPAELLRATSIVHSRWTEASSSRELWHQFCPAADAETHPKEVMKRDYTESVYVVLDTKLLRFFIGSNSWAEMPLAVRIQVDYLSSVVRTVPGELFVCGVKSRSHNTVSVRVHTGRVEPLPALSPSRRAMGVIVYKGAVYAFCGLVKRVESQQCTKFDLRTQSWVPLHTALQKRSSFTPCAFKKLIYLFGGTNVEVQCESFDTVTARFSSLPIVWQYATVAAVVEKRVVVINEDQIKVGEPGTRTFRSDVTPLGRNQLHDDFFSGYTPVARDSKLYVLQRICGRIVEFDVNTCKWKEHRFSGGSGPARKYKVPYRPQTAHN